MDADESTGPTSQTMDCVAIGSGQSLEEFEALKGVLFSTNVNN